MMIIVVIAVVLTSVFTVNAVYRGYEESITNELLSTLRLIDSSDVDPSSLVYGSRRFTEIAPDGTVIYDSVADSSDMDNHQMRPEVQMALLNLVGQDVRESSTLLESMFYVAILSEEGNVLRLSESQDSLYAFILSSLPFLVVILALIIILSLIVSSQLSRRIVRPINEIDLDNPMDDDKLYEELSPLVRRIAEQKGALEDQMRMLERDKNELSLIVKSMKDGLIIIRRNGEILMINDAAKTLMGKNTDEEFSTLIELGREDLFFSIIEKGSAEGRMKVEGRTVEVHAEDESPRKSVVFHVSVKIEFLVLVGKNVRDDLES